MQFSISGGVTGRWGRRTFRGSSLRAGKVAPSFLIGLVLSFLALAGIVAVLRWQDEDYNAALPGPSTAPSIEAEGARKVKVWEPKTGRLAWEFSAKRITVDAQHIWTTATDVRDGVFYREGKPYLKLQARQVRLNQQTRDLDATGSVTAQLPDGFKLTTQRAVWTHSLGRLEATGTVSAKGRDGFALQTPRAVWTQSRGQLAATGGVNAQTREGITLRTDRAVWTQASRRLEAIGGVNAQTRDGINVRAQRTVWTQGSQQLEATGDVSAHTRDGMTVHTQRAVWHHGSSRLEASGNVSAQTRDGFTARTQRAVWTHNDSRLKVPGAVTATVRGMIFSTRAISYDARSGQLDCPQPFRMEAAGITIRGPSAAANGQQQTVESHGRVKIVVRPGALRSGAF